MKEEDVARVRRIADRERSPMYVVGETTNDMKFVFEQADGVKPIAIKLEYMFGKPPRTIMKDHTVEETYAPVVYKESELHQYLENVLQLEAVACKMCIRDRYNGAFASLAHDGLVHNDGFFLYVNDIRSVSTYIISSDRTNQENGNGGGNT